MFLSKPHTPVMRFVLVLSLGRPDRDDLGGYTCTEQGCATCCPRKSIKKPKMLRAEKCHHREGHDHLSDIRIIAQSFSS